MTDTLKKVLRIFAASPSDVASERAKLETVVASLKPMADYLGLTLEVVDWRAVVPDAGRAQQIIFDQLKPTSWDIFVGILWHRFGTPSGAMDPKTQKEYLSGTEEEFKTVYELWRQYKRPRVMMYRCIRAFPFDVDPDQLKRVNDFFKLIEDPKSEYRVWTQKFDTPESFEKTFQEHLQKLLLEYGEQAKTPITPEVAQILAPKIPNNLPRRAAFFGRAKEMDVVMRALSPADRTWGVLVDGIGGIGKSALAMEAAHRAQETGAFDAFVFISAKENILKPTGIQEQTPAARTLDDFLNETARVLGEIGIAQIGGDDKRRVLLDALRGRRALLVFDNLETLSKEEQEATADFLRELPQACKAIITSRRRGGEGAVWLRVEQLDWDAARGIIENEMARDAGLTNKLRRVESRWQELFDEIHGSPLRLMNTLGLMRIRASLAFDGALEMLRGNRDADLQKFIFQEARKELTTNDKTALGALSFFVPFATFDAWMRVAELSSNALETAIDRLSVLALVDVLAGEERYALHPLTRNFVRDELLADGQTAREAGMRFSQYWCKFASRYGGKGGNNRTFARLEREWPNLQAAGDWLWKILVVQETIVEDRHVMLALSELALTTQQFLLYSGRWDERVQLNVGCYEITRTMKDWNRAGWHAYRVARVYYYRGDGGSANLWVQKCEDVWAHFSSKNKKSILTRMRGQLAQQRGDYAEAKAFFEETLSLGEMRIVLLDLGNLYLELGEYDLADEYCHKALKLARKKDDRSDLRAQVTSDLGRIALGRKEWSNAHQWFRKALPFAREIGRIDLIATAEFGIARVHEAEGRADLALPLAQEALKIYERLRHKDLAEVRELVERLKPPP